jgi:hypothetical protein
MAGRRTRSVVAKSVARIVSIDELCKLIEKAPASKKGTTVGSATAKGYCDNLKLIMRELNGNDNVIRVLEDFVKVDEWVAKRRTKNGEPLAINTKKKFYSSLNMAAKVLDLSQQVKEHYQTTLWTFMQKSEQDRKENYLPDKFAEAGQLPAWNDIKDISKQFPEDKKGSIDQVIAAIYTLTFPRRLEYFTAYWFNAKPSKRPEIKEKAIKGIVDEKGNPYNYFYKDKDGLVRVVLGDYKTSTIYGVFQNTYSKELSDIILAYVKKRKIKNGELFLTNKQRNVFKTSGDRSSAVLKAFSGYDKYQITVNNLRHIFETSLQNNDIKVKLPDWSEEHTYNTMTTNQKEQVAEMVGHSLIVAEAYRQVRVRPTKKKSKKQVEQAEQAEQTTPEDEPATEPIDIETVQPESVEPESIELPINRSNSRDMSTQTDGSGEAVTREDVLKSIKRYYDMKYEMIKKKMEMWDKVM